VLTAKLVLERFCAYTAGGFVVPRYKSYNVALLAADQFKVGVVDWLVAPVPGDVSATCPGRDAAVVNDHVLDTGADPAPFFAITFQKYVVPGFSAVVTLRPGPGAFTYSGGGLLVPRYRSYEVALLATDQSSLGVVD
jgi:hypothetical protein